MWPSSIPEWRLVLVVCLFFGLVKKCWCIIVGLVEPRSEPPDLTWPHLNLTSPAGCVPTTSTPRPPRHRIRLLCCCFIFSLCRPLSHTPKTLGSTHEAAGLLSIYFSVFFFLFGRSASASLSDVCPACRSAVSQCRVQVPSIYPNKHEK